MQRSTHNGKKRKQSLGPVSEEKKTSHDSSYLQSLQKSLDGLNAQLSSCNGQRADKNPRKKLAQPPLSSDRLSFISSLSRTRPAGTSTLHPCSEHWLMGGVQRKAALLSTIRYYKSDSNNPLNKRLEFDKQILSELCCLLVNILQNILAHKKIADNYKLTQFDLYVYTVFDLAVKLYPKNEFATSNAKILAEHHAFHFKKDQYNRSAYTPIKKEWAGLQSLDLEPDFEKRIATILDIVACRFDKLIGPGLAANLLEEVGRQLSTLLAEENLQLNIMVPEPFRPAP